MKAWIAAMMLALTTWPIMAEANLSVKSYEKWKNDSDVRLYIGGVGAGFSAANAALASQKKQMLFCVPERPRAETENYIQILDDTISKFKKEKFDPENLPTEILLLMGLAETFPCYEERPESLGEKNSP